MRKIICLLWVLLLVSCADSSVETENIESQSNENQAAETNVAIDVESQELNQGQEIIWDIPSMLAKLPDLYMWDDNFKFCVAQNVDACVSDFKFQNPELTSCEDFITESGREMCKTTEVTTQARESKSMELCDSLSLDGVNSCKNEVAISIWLENWKIDSCDVLSESYVNECKNQIILSNAISARDESICDSLITEEDSFSYDKEFCVQEIQMQIENDEFEKELSEQREQEQLELEAQMIEEERIMAEQEAQLNTEEVEVQ